MPQQKKGAVSCVSSCASPRQVFFRKSCLLLNQWQTDLWSQWNHDEISFSEILQVLSQHSGIGPEFSLRVSSALSQMEWSSEATVSPTVSWTWNLPFVQLEGFKIHSAQSALNRVMCNQSGVFLQLHYLNLFCKGSQYYRTLHFGKLVVKPSQME